MKVLVTGGCGYIGSHTLVDLIENGFEVISADSLFNAETTVLDAVEKITGKKVRNYAVDLVDFDKTKTIFEENKDLVGVIHFAAHKSVGESVEKPLEYFRNNLNSLLNILQCARDFEVPNVIFSSSCSVYGNAKELPVTEKTPMQEAESPYARTKQMGEQIIHDFSLAAKNVNNIILRYFNPAGAHPSALMGESPRQVANNLVPVITETAIGKRKSMTVFGDDYPTRDGSCIRDYIHVMDLANAHTKALQYLLEKKNESLVETYNLGIGEGATVLEAIHAFEKVSGQKLNYELGARRPGDVIAIYSNYEAAKNKLGWSPKYGMEEIMESAWKWEQERSR
jgi:UDP-glucose 4-epimerase